jgi:hypothetical protein
MNWIRIRNKLHDYRIRPFKLWFVAILNDRWPERYCWADCVAFAFSPERYNPFKIECSTGCIIESKDMKACYCGQFADGKCFGRLSEAEQEQIRTNLK